ncbi:hypothetical protein ASG67_12255 [Sphingomonas sp. Leaf339]|uniref:DUF3237 domain-containing protein n=1 Tax=Sphingomonas sp. Leaf339 TaxID=1736343 RepID=UPI0006F74987|nr:DUF3237 domain-containing protein [Sphingomonas sp. Leaf339]KQU48109.1 hypothetical protein ASG67_12255 [Sphingomonas sp. Leaf339]
MPIELTPDIQPTRVSEPELDFVMQTRVLVNPKLRVLGNVGGSGDRKMLEILGGDFEGPKLRGKILPGGGDWPLLRPDGVGIVDARYTFETDDGVYINIINTGYRHAPPETLAVLDAKRAVADPNGYYLRTYTRFEAPLGKYEWLSKHVFVGIGERHPEVLFLRYFMLL